MSAEDLRARLDMLEDELRDELAAWEWEGPNPSSAPADLIATILGVFQPALEQAEDERDAKDAEIGRLRRELAEANRRYEERSPTQWAYEQACHALEQRRERAGAAEAEVKRLTDLNARYADRAIENGQRAEQAEVKLANTKRLLDNRVQDCVDLTQRAEQAEAEVERLKAERAGWRSMAGVAEVEAERDRLREELRLARFDKERAEATVARLRVLRDDYWRLPGCSEIGDDLDAALDQAPAAEQDGGGE